MMQARFPPEERLAILKTTDSARKWYSLDDKRVCLIYDRVFTGRRIDIRSDQTLATRILRGVDNFASFACFIGLVALVGGTGMIAAYTAARESFKRVFDMAEHHTARYVLIALLVGSLWCWAR